MTLRLLLTAGEPAGIGPDLCLAVAERAWPCSLMVAGDPELLRDRARKLKLPVRIAETSPDAPALHRPGQLSVWPVATATDTAPGRLDPANARYVLDTIAIASRACFEGQADGLITAPVHKAVINQAGIPFTGHTEFIAAEVGGFPVMMLSTPGLRVALATTHLPLSQVSAAITRPLLERVLRILHRDLQDRFGVRQPRVLVAGLNPHAGEDGHLGREEIETIEPVLAALRSEGLQLEGPLPADTLFLPKYLERADAVLAMYHDQGLPVLKHKGFGRAVNITLGLPIIRTSVDHGTALDLAGSGKADPGSLEAAIETAITMATHKHKTAPIHP